MQEETKPTSEAVRKKLERLRQLEREAKKLTAPAVSGNGDQYERHKERTAARQRARSREGQDIGPIPEVKNWERRLACKYDLELYLRTYLGHQFSLPFSADHKRSIAKAQRAVLEGGLFAVAAPRGDGKTERTKGTCSWAINYGHRKFVLLIGATNSAAHEELLDGIRFYYESTDLFPLLLEDFPELVYPILKLEGESRKQGGQRCQGQKTLIHWGGNFVVMPTVPNGNWIDGKSVGPAPGAAATIRTTSITGRVRGFNIEGRRPDLVLPDDPQTDESAASAAGNRKIERILSRAVTGLGGHGKRIAGIMPCTVIQRGDAIDCILDHAKHPEWDSERTKMLYAFPSRMDLWEQYRDLRNNFDPHAGDGDKKRAASEATMFYLERHEDMLKAAVVAWPERYFPDELDGLQRAMNFFYDDREAFFSEGQNDPLPADLGNVIELTPAEITERLSGIPRGIVPMEATVLTSFIDVQAEMLFWACCAWKDDFTGWVVDYGTWPDQGRPYFTKRGASKTLAKLHTDVHSQEGQLKAGLTTLTDRLLGQGWKRENGADARIERCLIDSGYQAKVIYEFVRRSPYGGVMYASKGEFVGANSKYGVGEGKVDPGNRRGLNWVLPAAREERGIKLLRFDTNAWNSFVHARLAVKANRPPLPESLSLFGDAGRVHTLLADHLTAEYRDRVRSERTGREIDEWRIKPGNPDNDFLDCLVGCAVAASIQGIKLSVHEAMTKPKVVDYAAMYEAARRT